MKNWEVREVLVHSEGRVTKMTDSSKELYLGLFPEVTY